MLGNPAGALRLGRPTTLWCAPPAPAAPTPTPTSAKSNSTDSFACNNSVSCRYCSISRFEGVVLATVTGRRGEKGAHSLFCAERVAPYGASSAQLVLESHRYADRTRTVWRNPLRYDTGSCRYQPQQQANNNPPTQDSVAARGPAFVQASTYIFRYAAVAEVARVSVQVAGLLLWCGSRQPGAGGWGGDLVTPDLCACRRYAARGG